jgi:serine/threonine protein kinase
MAESTDDNQKPSRGPGGGTDSGALSAIGRFQIIRKIGRGAQGSVFLATDPQLGRAVAIKTVTVQAGASADAVDQLLREARNASGLSHPNLVPVYEVGMERGQPYVVFEYVEGRTLDEILRNDGAMPVSQAVIAMSQILAGVSHAHAKGLVHGDITPANILITPSGVPRVTDFGISRGVREEASKIPRGTLRYMAPEHFQGGTPDLRSDVYALGIIFYEMLTGQPAISRGDDFSVIHRVLSETIPGPSQTRRDIDSRLDQIVAGAIQKSPDARFADAGAMKAALDRFRIPVAPSGNTALSGAATHSTVEFLLLRMRRKADFPALSERLSSINRLTVDSNTASIQQLANLVLQDFALTNKLLKVVNSAAFQGSGQVTSVSEAIVKLGLDQVRTVATTLMLATPPKGRPLHPVFPEVMLGAFISAVIGRNLGRIAGLQNAEEVFICSMFSRLGDILAIYYFAEEYDEILELARTSRIDELRASRAVLGVGFDVLGIEVARRWNFPPNVLYAIRALPEGVLPQAAAEREWIAHCAGFARELCEAAWRTPESMRDEALRVLTTRFAATFPQASKHLRPLIAHSLKLGENYCKVLGIPTTDSPLIEGLAKWAMLEPATVALPRVRGHGAAPSQHERPREERAQARLTRTRNGARGQFANWLKSLWS